MTNILRRVIRITVGLTLGIILLGICRSDANVPGGGNTGMDVAAYMSGKDVVLANGIVTATIDPKSATIRSLRYEGREMISRAGRHQTIYLSMDGAKGFQGFPRCKLSVKTRTPDMVDISCKSTYRPQQRKMYPCNVDIHFVLRRGASGLYVYARFNHPADYPELDMNLFRLVWPVPKYLGNWLMEKIYVDAARHWELPTPADFARQQKTRIKEIVKLTTGLWKGKYDCKYMYSANYWDLGCWGFASDRNKIGVWAVFGSHEFFNDGPTLQDLTAASDLFHVEFQMQHYHSSSINIPRGESWQKFYGPILLYCNSSPQGGDGCWADARRQAEAEKAAWPYSWLTGEKAYPLESGRGTVRGKFVVHDRLKPDVSGAKAWVGVAQPPQAVIGSLRVPTTSIGSTLMRMGIFPFHMCARALTPFTHSRPARSGNFRKPTSKSRPARRPL